jgi:quinoprotein glucose dehydrogenase
VRRRPGAGRSLAGQEYKTWSDYAGSPDSAQYSALARINRANVDKLKSPEIFDGRREQVFVQSVGGRRMDVRAGAQEHDRRAGRGDRKGTLKRIRGGHDGHYAPRHELTESKDRSERRILFSSNHYLRAIDALSGKPVAAFGDGGKVDLKIGFDRDPSTIRLVQSMSPGASSRT